MRLWRRRAGRRRRASRGGREEWQRGRPPERGRLGHRRARGVNRGRSLVHRLEELAVGLGARDLVEEELHRVDDVERVQELAEQPDALERERQYTKAQVITQGANSDLAAMANYELSQVGGVKQITPQSLGELTIEEMFSA